MNSVITVEDFLKYQPNSHEIGNDNISAAINLTDTLLDGICNGNITYRFSKKEGPLAFKADELEALKKAYLLQTKFNLDYDNNLSAGSNSVSFGGSSYSRSNTKRDYISPSVRQLLKLANVYEVGVLKDQEELPKPVTPIINKDISFNDLNPIMTYQDCEKRYVKLHSNSMFNCLLGYNPQGHIKTYSFYGLVKPIVKDIEKGIIEQITPKVITREIENKVEKLQDKISDLQEVDTTLATRIDTNKTNISDLSTSLDTTNTNLNDLAEKVSKLTPEEEDNFNLYKHTVFFSVYFKINDSNEKKSSVACYYIYYSPEKEEIKTFKELCRYFKTFFPSNYFSTSINPSVIWWFDSTTEGTDLNLFNVRVGFNLEKEIPSYACISFFPREKNVFSSNFMFAIQTTLEENFKFWNDIVTKIL